MIAKLFLSGIIVWLTGAMATPGAVAPTGCRTPSGLRGGTGGLDSRSGWFVGRHLQRHPTMIGLPFGNPAFSWALRIDPLSAYFNVTLAVLAAAVSLYSFGYLRQMEGRRNLGAFGFFFNLLLLSLALVFTASNAFFFLVAWEVMALVGVLPGQF